MKTDRLSKDARRLLAFAKKQNDWIGDLQISMDFDWSLDKVKSVGYQLTSRDLLEIRHYKTTHVEGVMYHVTEQGREVL